MPSLPTLNAGQDPLRIRKLLEVVEFGCGLWRICEHDSFTGNNTFEESSVYHVPDFLHVGQVSNVDGYKAATQSRRSEENDKEFNSVRKKGE